MVLGLCGSLRAASWNRMMLRAASRLAPAGMVLEIYPNLGAIPLFNPDLEAADPPSVAELRRKIIDADALAIASPEYAHGVSGVIKNALDWMVGNESFVLKRVAVFNASPRASHARAALQETLRTMSAVVVDAASVELPLLGSGLDEDGLVAHPEFAPTLRAALEALAASGIDAR